MDLEMTITSTLSIMEEAPAYNRWIFEKIMPWLGQSILEAGCGTGDLTGLLLSKGGVIASDINEDYLQIVGDKFQGHPNLREIVTWDIREAFRGVPKGSATEGCVLKVWSKDRSYEAGERGVPPLHRSFLKTPIDTIVCSNVLEHIGDDDSVLKNFCRLLPVGGRLIVLVPALKVLYNVLDRELGHFRRYGRKELIQKLTVTGFKVRHVTFFNVFGILGWFVNGTLLRRRLLPVTQVRLFNTLVPFFIRVEKVIPTVVGQSLFAVAEKA